MVHFVTRAIEVVDYIDWAVSKAMDTDFVLDLAQMLGWIDHLAMKDNCIVHEKAIVMSCKLPIWHNSLWCVMEVS